MQTAWKLCTTVKGLEPKQIYQHETINIDKGHWSKIIAGQACVPSNKQNAILDVCGNEIPLIWWAQSRGYDWSTIRKQQTELEQQLEAERARADEAEKREEMLIEMVRKIQR